MAKFYGVIGYAQTVETTPGVWTESVIEKKYYGDVIRDSRRWQSGGQVNDDLTIGNSISIIADPFANDNLYTMKYIKWMGTYWKINYFELKSPRLIINIGGVYVGETAETTVAP